MEYDVGQRIGLAGTPLIVAPDGTAMPGYMPPKELRAELDKLAAQATGGAGSREGSDAGNRGDCPQAPAPATATMTPHPAPDRHRTRPTSRRTEAARGGE